MPSPSPPPRQVLIVDDMLTYRLILTDIIAQIPGAVLAGTAPDGVQALDRLAEKPVDLVLLDVEMPNMNGLDTLKAIRQRYPHIEVIMVSGANKSSADITIQALEAGALDFISKPDRGDMNSNKLELTQRLRPIIQLSRPAQRMAAPTEKETPGQTQPLQSNQPSSAMAGAPRTPSTPRPRRASLSLPVPHQVKAIAIGVSTGGPNALMEVIPKLPGNLGVPILIVQHMPPLFTASLASSLDAKSALRVKEAEHREPIQPNTVYIAPGGRHMVVEQGAAHATRSSGNLGRIAITDAPPENSCRPSVDVLFRSLAPLYGRHTLTLMMTGMGSDGAKGTQLLKSAGCYCVTQSKESCVVYGMPRAVDELELSDEQVALHQLAARITQLVQG